MHTLDEYAQKRRREALAERQAKAKQQKIAQAASQREEKQRLGIDRLHDEWDTPVRDLLDRTGWIVWPREGHRLGRWVRRFRVVSERRDLRWRLLQRRQRIHDDGSVQHTYAKGFEVRLTDSGFDLSAGEVCIRSSFDRADLEDAIVQLLEAEPEGRESLVRSERFFKWFAD